DAGRRPDLLRTSPREGRPRDRCGPGAFCVVRTDQERPPRTSVGSRPVVAAVPQRSRRPALPGRLRDAGPRGQLLSGNARTTLRIPSTSSEIAKSHQRNPAPHTGVLSRAKPARTEMIANRTVTAVDPVSPRVNSAV